MQRRCNEDRRNIDGIRKLDELPDKTYLAREVTGPEGPGADHILRPVME